MSSKPCPKTIVIVEVPAEPSLQTVTVSPATNALTLSDMTIVTTLADGVTFDPVFRDTKPGPVIDTVAEQYEPVRAQIL